MTDDQIKDLVSRLRIIGPTLPNDKGYSTTVPQAVAIAADALEALAGEVVAARKHGKLLNKMLGEAEAERDRLKAALEDAKEMVISWGSYAPTYFAEKHDLLGDVERLNKALGDAS